MGAISSQISNDIQPTTYNLPPCGGGRRMSSRRDDVRRVGGIFLTKQPPTRRLATLVGDLPHKGGGVRLGSGYAITFLIPDSAQRSRFPQSYALDRRSSPNRIPALVAAG